MFYQYLSITACISVKQSTFVFKLLELNSLRYNNMATLCFGDGIEKDRIVAQIRADAYSSVGTSRGFEVRDWLLPSPALAGSSIIQPP